METSFAGYFALEVTNQMQGGEEASWREEEGAGFGKKPTLHHFWIQAQKANPNSVTLERNNKNE